MITNKRLDKKQAGRESTDFCPGESHHLLPPAVQSIYSEEEERLLGPWQRIRQALFSPIVIAFSRLGISANLLSYTSVGLSIGFCLIAPLHFPTAFWLLVIAFALDGLDGVLARQTKTNSAKGSFTDTCCDQTALAFSIAGMTWIGAIHPVLAILYVYGYTTLVLFLILHHMLHVSSRWIVRPGRTLFYIFIGLDFFFHINLLNFLLLFYLLALPLLIISFSRLRKAL